MLESDCGLGVDGLGLELFVCALVLSVVDEFVVVVVVLVVLESSVVDFFDSHGL